MSGLTRRLESQSIAAEHKLQNEIQRIKETALAAEKIRRERWVRENTKKIKVCHHFLLNKFSMKRKKKKCNEYLSILSSLIARYCSLFMNAGAYG